MPFHDSSSLNLTNNVIVNDDTARLSLAILSHSYLNNATGQIVLPTLSGNQFFGVPTTNVSNLGTYGSGNTFQSLAEAPQLDTSHPWTAPTSVWDPSAGSGGRSAHHSVSQSDGRGDENDRDRHGWS